MSYSYLNGQVFKRAGKSYLVLDDSDWSSETLKVKTVDAARNVIELPVQDVLECLYGSIKRPDHQSSAS